MNITYILDTLYFVVIRYMAWIYKINGARNKIGVVSTDLQHRKSLGYVYGKRGHRGTLHKNNIRLFET